MERHLESTGHLEEYNNFQSQIPDFDPRAGNHLWIMMTTYKCDPARILAGDQLLMDHENLLDISGPGCYYCERPYSSILDHRRCKGQP